MKLALILAMSDPALIIQELQQTQTTNYITAAAGALVVYDQALTFSQEVNHIWSRQWSLMTALYLIARYSGSLTIIGLAAWDVCTSWTYAVNVNITLAVNWAANIFLLSMQAILVVRVCALFGRSKKISIFLATCYALQATTVFVMTVLQFNNRALHEYVASISPAIGSIAQNVVYSNPSIDTIFAQNSTIVSVVFNTVLLLFALWAFIRHALQAKTLDKGLSINAFVRTLVADHLVYFVCNLIWLSLSLASDYFTEPNVVLTGALNVFTSLAVIAGPRMVISIRAIENKTRREGVVLGGSLRLSTIRVAIREPPTQSERAIDVGGQRI
ncbi:hypothetical protein BJ138DRAFT_44995 [Hygrophoropsis aurantiaca]|uniref:Uncharacterized protein n=1 Tax=Hygrophoropsis aurantiaca TaxID=72124 RepID=A0ACB7ZSV0_9AGAM|nr:hypothetical protein BJ138DRAFT_44995 [Hygrophoropsis aurantiaca]